MVKRLVEGGEINLSHVRVDVQNVKMISQKGENSLREVSMRNLEGHKERLEKIRMLNSWSIFEVMSMPYKITVR